MCVASEPIVAEVAWSTLAVESTYSLESGATLSTSTPKPQPKLAEAPKIYH